MSYKALTYEKKDHVAIVSMGDPPRNRGEILHLIDELSDLCSRITTDKDVRVVILIAYRERDFCVGEDVIEEGFEASEAGGIKFQSIVEPVAKLDCPVIAAINGNAIGQGLELVLACDIRIGIETSHFGLPQIKTGRIPWDGGTQRLSRLVGRGKAMEMILTGEIIDAHEAYRIGLVNKIVSPDELTAITVEMAQQIAHKGPISLKYAKEAVYKGMDLTLDQGLHLEANLYLLLHTTRDRTEGIQAFQEKRTPKFEGR